MKPKENKHELENLLNNAIGITNYKGNSIMKVKGGYSMSGKVFLTIDELDKEIESRGKQLEKTIERNY